MLRHIGAEPGTGWGFVRCDYCDAEGPDVDLFPGGWNARAASPELTAVLVGRSGQLMRELTSPYAVVSLAERLEDWGEHDEGVISDRREEGAAPDLYRELTAALAREAALRDALSDAEYDLCQWLECAPQLIKAGFNMDGTADVIAKIRATLSVKP